MQPGADPGHTAYLEDLYQDLFPGDHDHLSLRPYVLRRWCVRIEQQPYRCLDHAFLRSSRISAEEIQIPDRTAIDRIYPIAAV